MSSKNDNQITIKKIKRLDKKIETNSEPPKKKIKKNDDKPENWDEIKKIVK